MPAVSRSTTQTRLLSCWSTAKKIFVRVVKEMRMRDAALAFTIIVSSFAVTPYLIAIIGRAALFFLFIFVLVAASLLSDES